MVISTASAQDRPACASPSPRELAQRSLVELYGLSTIIGDHIFGDLPSFRAQYMTVNGDIPGLKARLQSFCKRTLRKDVLEYIQYTEPRPISKKLSQNVQSSIP